MKKKLLFTLSVILGLGLLFTINNSETEAEKQGRQYAKFVKNHPYNKRMYLSKKERKSLGLPPNAYFEQEYLNEMNPNTGRTHPENIFELQKKLKSERVQNRVPGDEVNNPWVERGPNNTGGRTRALLFDPNDATNKRVFAGGVSGGLWVNNDITDENSSWQQVGVAENISVTCIAVDPTNSQIMYLGTGESHATSGVGNGIWKSSDGGNSWVNVFNNTSNANIRDNINYVNTIKVWNNGGKIEIFAGVAGAGDRYGSFPGANAHGLYKSTDNGLNWSRVTLPIIPGTTQGAASSIFEPNDIEIAVDNTIWMGSGSNIWGNGGGTILKSTDGINFTIAHTLNNGGRTEIALSKTDKDKVYVLASGTSAPVILVKTDDAFTTTTNMGFPNDADNDIPFNDFTRGQNTYNLLLTVDPKNEDILYVGGIDLFRSDDAGMSWKQMSKWSNNNSLAFQNIPLVHADQHGFAFHPTDSNKAIIGNDGGVYYASSLSDAVESNTPNNNIESRNKDYNTLQFYNGAIGQNTNSDIIVAGAQDNGTQFINGAVNNSSNAAVDVYGGDGAYTFIDKDGEYMIASYVYNVKGAVTLPYTGAVKELDNDQTTGSFINPQDLDDNLDILYSNGNKFATDASPSTYDSIVRYKGIKPGETLEKDKIGKAGVLNDRATALKVSPFTTGSTTLFVGLANAKLLKITNANFANPTWTSVGSFSFSGSISSIKFGNNEDEILVTFHNYGVTSVWYTTNGGTTWQNKEGDLPDIPVKDIMMNPLNNNQVIIATDLGVWTTNNFKDFMPKWVQAQNGMSNVKVNSLELRTADNMVLASTYGRGMFTGKFTAAVASVDDVLLGSKAFTVYPTVSDGNFTVFGKNELGNAKLNIFDISGKQVYKSNINFKSEEKQKVSVDLNKGVYIVNITDQNNKKSSKKIIIE